MFLLLLLAVCRLGVSFDTIIVLYFKQFQKFIDMAFSRTPLLLLLPNAAAAAAGGGGDRAGVGAAIAENKILSKARKLIKGQVYPPCTMQHRITLSLDFFNWIFRVCDEATTETKQFPGDFEPCGSNINHSSQHCIQGPPDGVLLRG